MGFRNNPGCNCCRHLPVWIYDGTDVTWRQNLSATTTISTKGSLQWSGQLIEGFLRELAFAVSFGGPLSRSYDVIYTHRSSAALSNEMVRQYPVTGTTHNWEVSSGGAAGSVGSVNYMSVGDHGIILHGNGVATWIAKDGSYVRAPQPVTGNVAIVGHGTYAAIFSGFLPDVGTEAGVVLSLNSGHAFAHYRTAASSTTAVIGTFDLVDNGGSYDLSITPSHTITVASERMHSYLGTGANDELYWVAHDGDGPRWIYLPGFGSPYTVPVSENSVVDAYFWPGNAMYFAYQIDTLSPASRWGTQSLDGVETINTIDTSVLSIKTAGSVGRASIFCVPVSSMFAVAPQLSPAADEATLTSWIREIFPKVDNIEDFIDSGFTTVASANLSSDHTKLKLRESFNDGQLGISRNNCVIRFDAIGGLIRAEMSSERKNNAAQLLAGTTAEFEATFVDFTFGTTPHSVSPEPEADDFEIHTTGTVTHGAITITKVTEGEYDVAIANVAGGVDGGTIALTLATPTKLEVGSKIPLNGAPGLVEFYDVAADP